MFIRCVISLFDVFCYHQTPLRTIIIGTCGRRSFDWSMRLCVAKRNPRCSVKNAIMAVFPTTIS